jgi:hypothetical protein
MYKFLFKHLVFCSLGYIPRNGLAVSYNSVFNILRNCQNCKWLHFTFPPALWSTKFFQNLVSICYCLPYFRHSSEWKVAFRYGSDCFLNWQLCRAWFHVLIGHLHIVFREMSTQITCPFLNWLLIFLCSIVNVLYSEFEYLIKHTVYKYTLPLCGLSSLLMMAFETVFFFISEVQFILFFLLLHVL